MHHLLSTITFTCLTTLLIYTSTTLAIAIAIANPLNEEVTALIQLKNSITNDPTNSLTNWNTSDPTPCSWTGVTCKNSRVISLSIPKKKLRGSLPNSLPTLRNLRHLNLRSNFLSGPIPHSIVKCSKLMSLVLSHNNLSGPIPSGLGKGMVSLQKFDVSFNNLSGPIPGDLGDLTGLQGTCDLSHNLLSGTLPPTLGELPEKVYIDVSFNNLSGPIPQSGGLINRGPTAFMGNPALCGPPLRLPCPAAQHQHQHQQQQPRGNGKGISRRTAVVAIVVVSDVVGICAIGWLVSCCCTRVWGYSYSYRGKGDGDDEEDEEEQEEEENVEQYDLVALDEGVGFDLEELLKASAFVLGKSGIGIVYKVVLEDGLMTTLAVRRLGEGGSQRFKEFQTEVEAIGKLRHPNVVTLRAYYWSLHEKLLIYDYVPNGTLATALHGKPGMLSFTPLSWSHRFRIMKGVARGLVYLHEFSPKKYVHGDLNPSNILLAGNMEPKIADFGLGRLANIAGGSPTLQSARMTSEKAQQKQTTTSAPSEVGSVSIASVVSYYQAPESLKAVKPSQKWDVYSYGVILLEMISGRPSLVQVANMEMDLVQWMQRCIEEKKPLVDVLDPELVQEADKEDEIIAVLKIAMACVHSTPEKRPTIRNIYDTLDRVSESIP
ncbi:hypothetical protein vseg_000556 [Gypsophila vaccaria]